MESKILLEGPLCNGLAWAQQAAHDKLQDGDKFEVRYDLETSEIGWHQVEPDLPVIGTIAPQQVAGTRYKLLGRFEVRNGV